MFPDQYESLLLTFHDPKIVDGVTVIGSDYGTQLRVVDSAVVSVDPEAERRERFVNSSVGQLAACIAAHGQYCQDIDAATSEDDELTAVDSFASTIQQIDPDCLSTSETWWSVIVEQMRSGLL